MRTLITGCWPGSRSTKGDAGLLEPGLEGGEQLRRAPDRGGTTCRWRQKAARWPAISPASHSVGCMRAEARARRVAPKFLAAGSTLSGPERGMNDAERQVVRERAGEERRLALRGVDVHRSTGRSRRYRRIPRPSSCPAVVGSGARWFSVSVNCGQEAARLRGCTDGSRSRPRCPHARGRAASPDSRSRRRPAGTRSAASRGSPGRTTCRAVRTRICSSTGWPIGFSSWKSLPRQLMRARSVA